ncbi:MAG TPA: adenosylcobinamide-GDP ribazoletransferase, partial [Humibacillus xanthopallidus]|nr:adenosylcobinamide-GDP ribazoletransferase [Humibacillus xanthopallidus]
MPDSWRLAVGTFTALPVRAPHTVDRRTLGGAMLLAPLTTAPVVLTWVVLALLTTRGLLPYAVAAVLALVVPALLSRALHLDGLADLADGLTSGHDRERSLEVMRRGNTGPAGATALVLVLGLDAACLA